MNPPDLFVLPGGFIFWHCFCHSFIKEERLSFFIIHLKKRAYLCITNSLKTKNDKKKRTLTKYH